MLTSKISLEEITQLITTNPLTAIDMIITAKSSTHHENSLPHDPRLLPLFSQAVLLSQGIDENLWANTPMDALFRKELDHNTRRFIGVCLLRLLASCDQCFQADTSFRYKVFDLFDNIFVNDIYKLYNINKNDQAYAKESILKGIVPSIEHDISTVITSLSNLDSISKQTFRKPFMDIMMNKKVQIIVFPFLPQDSQLSLTIRLNDIFRSIEDYLKVPELGMLQALEKAKGELQGYLQEAEQYNTTYSREYLGKVIKKLLDLLERHFASSPISRPAHLTITKLEKKYPISIKGTSFDLGIMVKNNGPGYAFDVSLEILSDSGLILRRSEIYLGKLDMVTCYYEITHWDLGVAKLS